MSPHEAVIAPLDTHPGRVKDDDPLMQGSKRFQEVPTPQTEKFQ